MPADARSSSQPSLWKGLLAGAMGGLIASFAMGKFFSLLPLAESNSELRKEDATVQAASAMSQLVFHHELTSKQKALAGPAVHYLFGMSMAAAYGAVVESWHAARAAWGLPFGAAVWLGAHVIVVPALGWSEPITSSPSATEAAEGAAHLVYGAVVETIRRPLRRYFLR